MKRNNRTFKFFAYLLLIILTAMSILPFWIMFVNATRSTFEIQQHAISLIPSTFLKSNWAAVSGKSFNPFRGFMNSAIITGNKLVTSTPPGADPFYGAPCMLIVLVKESPNAMYDGATVMQTLMLAAQSLGVNSIWIHRAKEEFESEEGKEILRQLGIEGDYVGIGHVALGYADSELPAPKPRKPDYIHWAK